MPLLDQPTIRAITGATNLNSIAGSIKASECILFLGAGVHFPNTAYNYSAAECPPLGSEFSETLAGECAFSTHFPKESVRNLQRVAMCYEITNDREALVKRIKAAVHTDKKPSRALHALAALPFPLIITTNYDQLFEDALRAAGKKPIVHVYSKDERTVTPDYTEATPQAPYVFKLHGDIQQPESIVITDEDYIQFVLRMSDKEDYHPVPGTFRYNFRRWPTLFVGYSLLDYNLRLLFKTLRWRMDKALIKPVYSVDPYPDPLIFDVWYAQAKHVNFIAQDVWTFVPAIYQTVTGNKIP
jgi:hypothetical protein